MKKINRLSNFKALSEATHLLQNSLGLEEQLLHLLRSSMGYLLARRGFIALTMENQLRLFALRGLSKFRVGDQFNEEALKSAGITAILPVGAADAPLGMLGVGNLHGRLLNEDDLEFLQALSGIASIVVAHAHAQEKADHLNRALNQKLQDLRALFEFSQGLKSTIEPESLVSMLALTLAGRWATRKYALAVWRPGRPTVLRQKGLTLPDIEILKTLPTTLPDAALVENLPDGIIKESLKNQQGVLLFPLRAAASESQNSEDLLGIVLLGPRQGDRPYLASDLEFGANITMQAVFALQNAWHIQEIVERNKLEAKQQAQKQADLIFTALAEVLPGSVLDGKYRLDAKIGMGGFGAVYRAMHLTLNRAVAVKIFRPSSGNHTKSGVERFRREGISACRVNHPNAVQVLDFGITDAGIAYLVMELLNGHSLGNELSRKQKLPVVRCAEILVPICNVLTEAHSAGIVHRDIKPDNIFLHQTAEGEIVKVVDFGLAKMFADNAEIETQHLTMAGDVLGTPAYMSPERIQGLSYDGRSDVYSLGVMLYEMLCGRLPFSSPDNNPYALAVMQITAAPRPLREVNKNVPVAVEEIVLQTLAKNPAQRPTTKELVREFLHALGLPVSNLKDAASDSKVHLTTTPSNIFRMHAEDLTADETENETPQEPLRRHDKSKDIL